MVFFGDWGLFLLFESTAGQPTAEEPALKPISPLPSNIPETVFPFSQERRSRHGAGTTPARGSRGRRGSGGSTLLSPPHSSPPLHPKAGAPSPLTGGWQDGCLPLSLVHSQAGRSAGTGTSAGQSTLSTASLFVSAPRPSSGWLSPALMPPSFPPSLPPQSSISSVPRTRGPLSHRLPATQLLFPPATFSEKQTSTPKPTFFSKQPSHFLFASPSPSLSWVSLLFVLAILGWRLFGEGNTV